MLTTEVHAEKKEECGDDKRPMINNKDYFDIAIVTMAESVGLLLAYFSVDRLGRLRWFVLFSESAMLATGLKMISSSLHAERVTHPDMCCAQHS